MKINKQFLKISVTAFVLTLVTQTLNEVIFFVSRYILIDTTNFQIIYLLGYLNILVSYTIGPILMFVVFYFIGKKPNLMFELKPISFALLIGNIASLFVSSIIFSAVKNELSVLYIADYTGRLMLILLSISVLSALAGLAIGYIRRKNLTMKAESEPSPNI